MALLGKYALTALEMKARRAQEASQALKDYEAERSAVRANTARLREERLAREAENPPLKKKPKKTAH